MVQYDTRSFVYAYIDSVRYERAHADLATFHRGLYDALSTLFGLDLRQLPTPRSVFFKAGVDAVLHIPNALAGSMEMPSELGPLYERHFDEITRAANALHLTHMALLVDIVESALGRSPLWSSEDLHRVGFDDSEPPDPMDYW